MLLRNAITLVSPKLRIRTNLEKRLDETNYLIIYFSQEVVRQTFLPNEAKYMYLMIK